MHLTRIGCFWAIDYQRPWISEIERAKRAERVPQSSFQTGDPFCGGENGCHLVNTKRREFPLPAFRVYP